MSTQNPATPTTMHPYYKMTWKRALKIERIARLSLDPAGYTNEQIGNHLGCTAQTIVIIRQLPEYQAKMLELSSGVVSMYDQQLREETENARAELRSMVPSAMMVIRNALLSKNEAMRFKAATEVMDREGNLAKVSKTSVSLEKNPDMRVDPDVAQNLMQLLTNAPILTHSQEITAATGGFTSSSAGPDTANLRVGMTAEDAEAALEELDLSLQKPN